MLLHLPLHLTFETAERLLLLYIYIQKRKYIRIVNKTSTNTVLTCDSSLLESLKPQPLWLVAFETLHQLLGLGIHCRARSMQSFSNSFTEEG